MSAKRLSIAAVCSFGLAAAFAPPLCAANAAPAGATACFGCHAAGDRVATPVPRLIGLDAAYVVRAMQEFRAGTRPATVMDRIARGFTDAEVQSIAEWYARQR